MVVSRNCIDCVFVVHLDRVWMFRSLHKSAEMLDEYVPTVVRMATH